MPVQLPDSMPERIAKLPRDHRGYPVPWFVAKVDGKWDFRIMRPNGVFDAIKRNICWVCGEPLSSLGASFVIGPMCAVNRTSAEPPSHHQCAVWSAKVCPFLSKPHMKRQTQGLAPDASKHVPGIMLDRNPGVTLVWPVTQAMAYKAPNGGLLFNVGEPARKPQWFAEGREATYEEIEASIQSGLPTLMKYAEAEGPDAVAELERRVAAVEDFMPERAAA